MNAQAVNTPAPTKSNTGRDRLIRPLEQNDIELLQTIDRAAHGSEWSQRTFLDEIEQADRIHLVLESHGQVAGHAAAWIDGASCRITNVAIADDHTGQGHASALLIGLLNEALTIPTVMNMQLEVRPTNRRAQRLYSRFGFLPVGIERSFYDRGDSLGNKDAVVMAIADVCSDAWRRRLGEIANQPNREAVV